MESTVKAIESAGAKIGRDYLAGEKTPVAVLELFYPTEDIKGWKLIEPEGSYHDFWQAIVSGAKGIMIYSYFHRQDLPEFEAVWQMLNKAASQISGTENLGRVEQ